MELRHLRYFVAVGGGPHYLPAAETPRGTQPPLSPPIQSLQTESGCNEAAQPRTRRLRSVVVRPGSVIRAHTLAPPFSLEGAGLLGVARPPQHRRHGMQRVLDLLVIGLAQRRLPCSTQHPVQFGPESHRS